VINVTEDNKQSNEKIMKQVVKTVQFDKRQANILQVLTCIIMTGVLCLLTSCDAQRDVSIEPGIEEKVKPGKKKPRVPYNLLVTSREYMPEPAHTTEASRESEISLADEGDMKLSLLADVVSGKTNITREDVWTFYNENRHNLEGKAGRIFIYDLWHACGRKGEKYGDVIAWFCEFAEEEIYELLGKPQGMALQAEVFSENGHIEAVENLIPKLKRPEKSDYPPDYDYAAYHLDMLEYTKAMKSIAKTRGDVEECVYFYLEAACTDPEGHATTDCIFHAAEVYFNFDMSEKAIPLLKKYLSLDEEVLYARPKYWIDGKKNPFPPPMNVDFIQRKARELLEKCQEAIEQRKYK
jgi:hypothetical protein